MADPEIAVLPAALIGEDALTRLPLRGVAPSEVYLEARSLTSIDAFGGVALRACAEYHARYRQKQVMVTPPADLLAWAMLFSMLENDPPKHLILPNHRISRPAPQPRSILVPAIRVPDSAAADALG